MAAKLPSVQSFGESPVPQSRQPVATFDPSYSAAAAKYGATSGSEGLTKVANEYAGELFKAQARLDSRKDALSRVKDYNAFTQRGEGELQRLITESDLSDTNTIDQYNTFLSNERDRILKEHKGGEDSRLALGARLDTEMGKLSARATAQGVEQGNELIKNHLGSQANVIANKAWQNPGSLPSLFKEMDAEIANVAQALRPGQEDTFTRAYRERITEAAVGGLIKRGQLDDAESYLKNPALGQLLGQQAQDRIWGQYLDAKNAINKAREAGLANRESFIATFGRPPRNDAEMFQFLGKNGQQPDNQVEEIGDASSPTGTRVVPRNMIGTSALLDPERLKMYPPGKPSSGLNVEMDSEGRVKSITTGRQGEQKAGAVPGMGTEGGNAVDKDLLAALNTRQSLSAISQRFKPEFQQIPTRAGMSWTAFRDKADIGSLSPQDKASLEEFTSYRAEAGQMFSNVLKQLSGVAVNPSEMKRAESYLPAPGTGVFDGDSPTELQAKVKRFTEFNDKAIARLAYTKAHGVKFDSVNLDDMPKIIRARGAELEKLYGNLSEAERTAKIKTQIAKEFGFVGP